MLVSFFPPPSQGGIVVYTKQRAVSSILGLELLRDTEVEDRNVRGRLPYSGNAVWVTAQGLNIEGLLHLHLYDVFV